ncbi:MAG: SDR family oxidoreductase [Vicinamibacterales bacterium]
MVLLVGATGRLGGRVARELLSRRTPVRALCRPQSGSGALRRMGAEIAIGDLKDAASLAAACAGVETVVTTANSARRGGDDTVDTVDRDGTASLIDAAAAAGVQHFVYVSAFGAAPDSPTAFLAAKGANEARVRASGMAWTVLAPYLFMESWPGALVGVPALARRPIVIVGEGRRRHSFVAEHDVAAFVAASVLNVAARNRYVPVGGPDSWTWRDVIASYEKALDRPLEAQFVARGETVNDLSPLVRDLLAKQDDGDTIIDMSAVAEELGVRQTPLDAWVRASVATARV